MGIIQEEFQISDIIPPYDFDYALTHYNIYPWIQEDNTLARVLRLSAGKIVKAEICSLGSWKTPLLQVIIKAVLPLDVAELDQVRKVLTWCLKLDLDLRPFAKLCRKDPVLKAAMGTFHGARGKTYPTVYEAIIGVICAQNTVFKRLYSMMHNLSTSFGDRLDLDNGTYFAFPTPQVLASASDDSLRACKVGYRAKFIKKISEEIINSGTALESLKDMPTDEAREKLLALPGVGPYTANLVLSVGLRREGTLHLDSYVREAIYTFYFHGRKVSDQTIIEFAKEHWPGFESNAIGLLTTDTQVWAEKLGVKFRLKSGAQ